MESGVHKSMYHQEKVKERLTGLISPLVASLGLELWGIEIPASPKGGTLRLYIDGPGGVNVDQCAEVSRHVSALLDVEDPLPGPYTLEVSSPGLERPFFSLEQLGSYKGQLLEIKLKEPFEGRKKWRGLLLETPGNRVRIEVEGRKVDLLWDAIQKINLKYLPQK